MYSLHNKNDSHLNLVDYGNDQCKAHENFFLPSDTLLTLAILLQTQKDDTVLSIVYKWLKQ